MDGKGGLAVINKSIPYLTKDIHLNNTSWKFQIMGIVVEGITAINAYCPPDITLSINKLQQIVDLVNTPFILMGDLNGQ